MAKGKATRREFDWRTYTKPRRLLTVEQECSFGEGLLSPLLAFAQRTGGTRFEIRARQAAIYHDGTMLLRIRGADRPFVGEIDANVRLPRSQRTGAELLEMWPLTNQDEVSAVVSELDTLITLEEGRESGGTPSDRGLLHAFASANDGRSSAGARLVVADTEFPYGRRRFDFVGMQRAEGVGGSAGFTTPRLVFGQFKSGGKPLGGTSGLVANAADFVDFAQALGGAHLANARAELDQLVAQKLRLGLLGDDIPFRHFTEDDPEYLVVFSGVDLASPALDATLAETHDKLVGRHWRPELVRFAVTDSRVAESPASDQTFGVLDALDYRTFKRYRKDLRLSAEGGSGTAEE
jgi:hypothetical protein